MIISDLNHLEVVSEASSIEGGLLNSSGFGPINNAPLGQGAGANAGGPGINLIPIALALNLGVPIQLNL